MMKRFYPRRRPGKRSAIAVFILLFVVLLTVAVLERGWIRNSALAWYGTRVAEAGVDKAFNDSFTDFNRQLKANGVVLAKVHDVNLPCSTAGYHRFRVTVTCEKSRVVYANPYVPDRAVANWPALYRTLTSHMTDGKARVVPLTNVTPSTLFVYQPKPTGFPENDLRLEGRQGKVTCSIDMIVGASHLVTHVTSSGPVTNMRPAELFMTENCTRQINFFGGWDCDRHPCKQPL